MEVVVGPILKRGAGYAFDSWTIEGGLSRGYNYARNAEIGSRRRGHPSRTIACGTVDEFNSAMAEH